MNKYKPLTKASKQHYITTLREQTEVQYVVYGITVGKQWQVVTYSTEELAIQHARDAQFKANELIVKYGNDVPQGLNAHDKAMKVVDGVIEYIVESKTVQY